MIRHVKPLVAAVSVLVLVGLFVAWPVLFVDDPSRRVVVYCAHDREFADAILRDFEKRTGLRVVVRYDTEANKAVGLYEDLVREKDLPRADVHWNNEILATMRLQDQGILAPYASPSAAAFPASLKSADHTWTGFGARARVLLLHEPTLRKLAPEEKDWPRTIWDLVDPRWRGKATMAKPFFGMTATQAVCLFQVYGPAKAEELYRRLRANGIAILPGNKQTAVAVGKGRFPLGMTDTDDAVAEVEAGNPVRIVFLEHTLPGQKEKLGPLFVPNTVALIRGGPNPEGGKLLIDHLLSPEVEEKLARSSSRQIPVNPQVKVDLPAGFRTPAEGCLPVDFRKAAGMWEESQSTLQQIFAGG